MALPLVSDVTAQARAIIGDIGAAGAGETYTDAVLIPFVQRAYRYAARYLRAQDVGLLRKQSATIATTAGATQLTRSVAPLYPSDMLRPLALRERKTGTSVAFTPMQPSQNNAFLPDLVGTTVTTIKIWDFRDDAIVFPASTENRDLQILYEAELAAVTAVGNTLLIPDSLDPLASLTAAFAAMSRDESKNTDKLMSLADRDLDLIAKCEKTARTAKTAAWGTN